MLILYDHIFRMVLSLFSMWLQSSSWQLFSRMLRLAPIISFTSPNLVFLIYHEFEGGGVRCIFTFSIIVFLTGLYIFPFMYMYIFGSLVLRLIQSTISNIFIGVFASKFLFCFFSESQHVVRLSLGNCILLMLAWCYQRPICYSWSLLLELVSHTQILPLT
jgi:hypothetical protein